MRIIEQTGYTTHWSDGSSVILNPGSGLWEVYHGRSNDRVAKVPTREEAEAMAQARAV